MFDTNFAFIGGLTTIGKTDRYWVNSGKKFCFDLKWLSNQPDNMEGKEMCLSIGNQSGNFYFNDISCSGSQFYNFICQRNEKVVTKDKFDDVCHY